MADRCPRCKARGFESGAIPCEACGWQDAVLEPWVPSGWYQDPANPEKARYYSAPRQQWLGRPRKERFPPVPTRPPAAWLEKTDPTRVAIAVVEQCLVLGGHGLGLDAGARIALRFEQEGLRIEERTQTRSAVTDAAELSIAYRDIQVIEIGGAGTRSEGGGFYGGGFGLSAAAEGLLVASALNLLTTRTRTDTVICLRTASAELFIHHGTDGPEALRIRLSQVFNILRAGSAPDARSPSDTADADVVDRLAKLADLLDRGLLTSDEFASLKASLMSL